MKDEIQQDGFWRYSDFSMVRNRNQSVPRSAGRRHGCTSGLSATLPKTVRGARIGHGASQRYHPHTEGD